MNVKRAMCSGKREATNAERDCHRKFTRLGFSLPLTIESIDHEIGKNVLTTKWVKVSTWLKYFLSKAPSSLGIATVSFQSQCKAFWDLYQQVHPTHMIYGSGKDLSKCVPISLYGDEGKGPKRANYLDITWETPFGLSEFKSSCTCADELRQVPQDAIPSCQCDRHGVDPHSVGLCRRMSTTQKGHSYLTRRLVFGLPSYQYKANRQILHEHMVRLAEDMISLFENGVLVDTGGDHCTFFGVLIGIKGDMKFHAETAGFTRCYSNLSKKGNTNPMCAWCLAGSPGIPFEETAAIPGWVGSMFAERPWRENNSPQLAAIPFDSSRPEFAFKFDPFHLLKVGISRDLTGSIIIILARLGFFDMAAADGRDLPSRLERAHGNFKLFCLQQGKSPGLRSFSRSFFNYQTTRCTPWTNSKGSDSTLLVKWLTWFIGLQLATDSQGVETFLKIAKQVLLNVTGLHKICETHGLFLERQCAQRLYIHILAVCRGYHALAHEALGFRMIAFGVKPKYHALKHVLWELRKQLVVPSPLVLSPAVWGCEQNEDHVGRVSALSRTVSVRTLTLRIHQRYFLKTRALLVRNWKVRGKGIL